MAASAGTEIQGINFFIGHSKTQLNMIDCVRAQGEGLIYKPSAELQTLLTEPKKPFIHRDLSWLQFNTRVLDEATDQQNPLLERAKFLSISASNLDEFFMIRMAFLGRSLSRSLRKKKQSQSLHFTNIYQLIHEQAARFVKSQLVTLDELSRSLREKNVFLALNVVDNSIESSHTLHMLAKEVFEEKVLPDLEPPESFSPTQILLLENLQLAAVFPEAGMWFKVPKKIKPTFVKTVIDAEGKEKNYVFFLDQLLSLFLSPAFSIASQPTILRLTRDGDLGVDLEEEDPESIPEIVRSTLSKREKGRPVRLQFLSSVAGIGSPATSDLANKCMNTCRLQPMQLFHYERTFCLHGLWSAINALPPSFQNQEGMLYPAFRSVLPEPFENTEKIFELLKLQDFVLHHPYDSFDSFVEWVKAACNDPHTVSIEQTVYRMDALSPVIEHLKNAAKVKKVRVVIELRARFDELNNLRLSDELRKAGVEVHFGFGKLKLHAKIALVTRLEGGELKLYTHLSTGNYNSITARQYTDLAILTAHREIGEDARHFFDAVCKGVLPDKFKVLIPAPAKLHKRIRQLIESEMVAAKAGKPARIVGKVNALVDPGVVAKLYEASQAGVQIDLIVRGACSLVPGVKGLSENIRVVSIVDRFLEHSRIYYFENSNVMYISSADWMPRNFFSRLELAFPVLDSRIYSFIKDTVIPTFLADNVRGRVLNSNGEWLRKEHSDPSAAKVRAQFSFESLAQKKYVDTALYFVQTEQTQNEEVNSDSARTP